MGSTESSLAANKPLPRAFLNTLRFTDASSLAAQAGEMFVSATASNPGLLTAFSGGRISRAFFEAIAAQSKSRGVGLGAAHFFWADERCVPPADPENCFKIANEALFIPLVLPSANIHRIPGELSGEDAAKVAESEICRIAPLNGAGVPVLDLIILGMGEDGHVASLFPGETGEVMGSKPVYRPVVAVKPPPRRVTISYAAIEAAREVWVLASGGGKERALADALTPGDLNPLGRVIRISKAVTLFTDIRL